MGQIFVPYISPIRFRPRRDSDILPRVDKMRNRVSRQRGIYSNPNYSSDWLIGEQIVFQMRTNLSPTEALLINLGIYTPTGFIEVAPVDVTPSGWNGDVIIRHIYTPTIDGDYIFLTNTDTPSGEDLIIEVEFITDVVRVRANDSDLIELVYWDSDNRYTGVFYDDTTLIWQPKVYYTGLAFPGEPKNEYTIYKTDPAAPKKTKAEPQDTITAIFTDITYLELKKINRILSCDNLLLNGQPVQNEDEPEIETKEKSDLITVKVNFTETENDGFVKNY